MRIFNSIQFTNSEVGPICRKCTYFQNDPALIEEAWGGLTSMSSGFASVRDRDGFCNYHQLYLSARDSCPHFTLCTPEFNKDETGRRDQTSILMSD